MHIRIHLSIYIYLYLSIFFSYYFYYLIVRSVNWENKAEYMMMVKGCRLREWEARERINHIQVGQRNFLDEGATL